MHHDPEDYLFSDPLRHWVNGANLWSPNFMGASDPILYQCYVWLIRGAAQDGRSSIGLLCGLLAAFMPWTYYRAALELGFSRTRALAAWAMITWTPSLVTIYHYFRWRRFFWLLWGSHYGQPVC
jgi:hypothetical protein